MSKRRALDGTLNPFVALRSENVGVYWFLPGVTSPKSMVNADYFLRRRRRQRRAGWSCCHESPLALLLDVLVFLAATKSRLARFERKEMQGILGEN